MHAISEKDDTVAKFWRDNEQAFQATLAHILMRAKELKILKVGMVSVDGTKIDANASKVKSLGYDWIKVLRAKLEKNIAELMARTETTNSSDNDDGLSLPEEMAWRQTLKAKLDAAAKRVEKT